MVYLDRVRVAVQPVNIMFDLGLVHIVQNLVMKIAEDLTNY